MQSFACESLPVERARLIRCFSRCFLRIALLGSILRHFFLRIAASIEGVRAESPSPLERSGPGGGVSGGDSDDLWGGRASTADATLKGYRTRRPITRERWGLSACAAHSLPAGPSSGAPPPAPAG